jgi:hypothetical protein
MRPRQRFAGEKGVTIMTMQISDSFSYRGRSFSLAGFSGEGLFRPDRHGMELKRAGTFCYRGFVAHYDVWDDTKTSPLDGKLRTILRLKDLRVNPADRDTLPLLLFGAPLEIYDRHRLDPNVVNDLTGEKSILDVVFGCRYTDCPEPLNYTGGLLLGRNLISELSVNQGFSPAWKYRQVHELVFEDGVLIEEHDRSAQMAKIRKEQNGPRPKITSAHEYMAWIADSFSLKYERGTF